MFTSSASYERPSHDGHVKIVADGNYRARFKF